MNFSAIPLPAAERSTAHTDASQGSPRETLRTWRSLERVFRKEENSCDQAGLDIEARNSALVLFFERRPRSNSIASTVERGLSTLRNTQMRFSSSGGSRSSSLRVTARVTSI